MKKILLLSALIISLNSFGQYIVNQSLGSDSTLVTSKGALKSRIINKVFTDTTQANTQRIKFYDGSQIITITGGNKFWIRDSTLNKWVQLVDATYTGFGNTDSLFGVQDNLATAARAFNVNGNTLSINNGATTLLRFDPALGIFSEKNAFFLNGDIALGDVGGGEAGIVMQSGLGAHQVIISSPNQTTDVDIFLPDVGAYPGFGATLAAKVNNETANNQGAINLSQLSTLDTLYKPMVVAGTTTRYFNSWAQLTAALGLGGATPTWDATLAAGSTITANRTIAGGGFDFKFNSIDSLVLNAITSDLNATTDAKITSGNNIILTSDQINLASSAGITTSGGVLTVNNTATEITGTLDLSGIVGSHNADDSVLVWRASSNRVGYRPIPTSILETATASSSTPTPTGNARENFFDITALAANATFAAPSGTPANHNTLLIRVKDNGSARTLAWNAIYRASTDLALPTTTVISKTDYYQFVYNSADSKWDYVGQTKGF